MCLTSFTAVVQHPCIKSLCSTPQHGAFGNSSPRALSKEVGGASSRALVGESGWKGRAQQILLLKNRVQRLESQLRKDGQVRWGDCGFVRDSQKLA